MLAGSRDPKEILASVRKGLYAVNFGSGQVRHRVGQVRHQRRRGPPDRGRHERAIALGDIAQLLAGARSIKRRSNRIE
jgi:hypothetical protein